MFTSAFATTKYRQNRAGGTSEIHFLTKPWPSPHKTKAINVGVSQTRVDCIAAYFGLGRSCRMVRTARCADMKVPSECEDSVKSPARMTLFSGRRTSLAKSSKRDRPGGHAAIARGW